MKRCFVISLFWLDAWALTVSSSSKLLLLSDLSTPALVIDIDRIPRENLEKGSIPSIIVDADQSGHDNDKDQVLRLVPQPLIGDSIVDPQRFEPQLQAHLSSPTRDGEGSVFWHTAVTKSRVVDSNDHDEDQATITAKNAFLAKVDIPPFHQASNEENTKAKLVLGWNNHHVISYYWARSAGAGAAMEAPGVEYDETTSTLQWASELGPADCNTNDGKRSEWVNFLTVGDQIQLLPDYPWFILTMVATQHQQSSDEDKDSQEDSNNALPTTIYGISSHKRPLGSEPQVVCEWTLQH